MVRVEYPTHVAIPSPIVVFNVQKMTNLIDEIPPTHALKKRQEGAPGDKPRPTSTIQRLERVVDS